MGLTRFPSSGRSGDLSTADIDAIECDLDKLGTPPDNYFRQMIAEIRRRRAEDRAAVRDSDLEIVAGCLAAHPDRRGGQHVGKTCTDVLVIHKPTGIAVREGSMRSQFANRERALARLQSLLDAVEYEEPIE